MNYQDFIEDQKLSRDLAFFYRNNPEFRNRIDADPKSIFKDRLTDVEVIIKQDSDEVMYFILIANTNQAINDEDISSITAAKLQGVTIVQYGGDKLREVVFDTENGKHYRRYKGDPSDPTGRTHFIEVQSPDGLNALGHEQLNSLVVEIK